MEALLKQNEGIAICTTLKMMKSALADSPKVLFAIEVQYLDYQKD